MTRQLISTNKQPCSARLTRSVRRRAASFKSAFVKPRARSWAMTGNPSLTGKGRVADHSPGIPPESRGTRNLARNASQLADSRPTVQWGADSTWSVQSTTGKFRCCCSSRKRGVERRLSKYCEMRANGVPEFSQIILPEWALQARSSQSRESAT